MKNKITMDDKVLIGTMVILMFLVGTLFFTTMYYKAQLRDCKDNSSFVQGGDIVKDSLQNELFISQTMNGRYELAIEELKQTNPSAVKELETILSKIE